VNISARFVRAQLGSCLLIVVGLCSFSGLLLAQQQGPLFSIDRNSAGDYHWDKTYFVSRSFPPRGQAQAIRLLDATSHEVHKINVTFADASDVKVLAVSLGTDDLVAAGYAINSWSAGAYYIADLDLRGSLRSIVRTNPFVPLTVCNVGDGTVWSFGRELIKDEAHDASYDMLRHYSLKDGLLESFLPRSSFRISPILAAGDLDVFLRCSPNGVTLYSEPARTWIAVNLGTTGSKVRREQVILPAVDFAVTGFEVTPAGVPYMSAQWNDKNNRTYSGLLRLDHGHGDDPAKFVPLLDKSGPIGSGEGVNVVVGVYRDLLICVMNRNNGAIELIPAR
jgi:hypothetical protein